MLNTYGPSHASPHTAVDHRFHPYSFPPSNAPTQMAPMMGVKHEHFEPNSHVHSQGIPPPTLMIPVHPHYSMAMPPSVSSYGFPNNSNVASGEGSSHSSMSPGQKHKSGGSDSNNPLEINIPEFKERFEKWMVDLSNSGRDMSCFFFDEEKGGIFCRICIEASKSGGFCTKPAQEQARRCLTKHLNREKHKSALQQLRKEGKIGPNVVIASGATGLLEDFDPVGDDRSDSNDDDEHSHFNNNSHYTDNNNINNSHSNNHHLEQSLNYSNANQDIPDDKKLIFPMTVQPISPHKSSKKMKKKKRLYHPPMPPPAMGYPAYIPPHTPPFDRALYAHLCVVHLMAKDCYERLYVSTLQRLKSSTETQEKEKEKEKEKEHENENNKESETEQNKEKEREQMQQLMSQFTIDDIVLNENKYRGLLTIAEFLGGPNSILYEATFQSLDFAKTLLKSINEAANVFKLQMSAESKIQASEPKTTPEATTSDNNSKDQNKSNEDKDPFKSLGELFWLDNTLRMNSTGRSSMQLYVSAIGIFHEKYARDTLSLTHLPPWATLMPPPTTFSTPMTTYSGASPPVHGVDPHGIGMPPPPPLPPFGFVPHPYLPPGYPMGPPPGNMPVCPPGLEPTVKQERVADENFNDVGMKQM